MLLAQVYFVNLPVVLLRTRKLLANRREQS
jgi:hypothetical protein